jgi:hypothetical protein
MSHFPNANKYDEVEWNCYKLLCTVYNLNDIEFCTSSAAVSIKGTPRLSNKYIFPYLVVDRSTMNSYSHVVVDFSIQKLIQE